MATRVRCESCGCPPQVPSYAARHTVTHLLITPYPYTHCGACRLRSEAAAVCAAVSCRTMERLRCGRVCTTERVRCPAYAFIWPQMHASWQDCGCYMQSNSNTAGTLKPPTYCWFGVRGGLARACVRCVCVCVCVCAWVDGVVGATACVRVDGEGRRPRVCACAKLSKMRMHALSNREH